MRGITFTDRGSGLCRSRKAVCILHPDAETGQSERILFPYRKRQARAAVRLRSDHRSQDRRGVPFKPDLALNGLIQMIVAAAQNGGRMKIFVFSIIAIALMGVGELSAQTGTVKGTITIKQM